ncbi:ribonuclease H-like domain-containing protein [Tanacetum coccineum]|uniref:Ribonuclease H-like domain-containing protein n=1 Tax=Tanacetum coccineum TaxID=301880 RepID=A0ABQ4YN78_9ASTR
MRSPTPHMPQHPNTPTPQGPTPTEPSPSPQSTLLTSIAHNHASGPSTSAHQASPPSPSIFNFPNPQPNTEPIHEPLRTHPMITSSQSGIVKPIDHLTLYTSSISHIPNNPSHALKDPNWRNAMYDKYNALVKNDTWLLVPRPAGVNMVCSMWLFKHKFHADRTLSHYKARLVANSSSQQLGVDFDETFSPVVKPATVRMVLSLAMSHKWPIHQLDVKNAFLNSNLSETVYMHQPPGFVDNRYPHHVCLLQRSLYGLKQAPRIIGSLNNEFDMTDFVTLNYFLGISADRTPTGLFLSQKKYALQLLERTHMVTCNPSQTPINTESKLDPEGVPVQNPTLYRILAGGAPLYVSATTSLVGYTDADWAGCPSTRRSTSSYYVLLGDNILSWSAKRQHTISRFSAEAEYRGVANVVAETASIRNLLRELHSPLSTATLVYYDNVSAVYMSANPVQHQRTKHIEINIHFVRDMVTVGHVRVIHAPSRFRRMIASRVAISLLFLMGMDNYYQPIKSALLTRDPFPEVKDAYTIVSREESYRGANQHLAVSTVGIFNVVNITSLKITVGHPNGTLATISHVENLKMSNNVILYDVLVVPGYCDLKRESVMGTNNEFGGPYLLGHPADQVLSALHNDLKISKSSFMHVCEICHGAKHARKCFPLSSHKSKTLGKLVHLDLWGPYGVTSREGFRYYLTIVDDFSTAIWLPSSVLKVLNNSDKFSYKLEKSVLIGYSFVKKAYKLLSLDSRNVFYSKDVKFYETVFPFKMKSKESVDA